MINGMSPMALELIWLEKVASDKEFKINIKTPEEKITLIFSNQATKNKWFHTLNKYICEKINHVDRSSVDSLESNQQQFSPPLQRNAKHYWEKGDLTSYEGGWYDGIMSGKGLMKYKDGSKYDGSWRDGKKHGWGTLKRADHSTIEGNWVDDAQKGPGKIIDPSGNVYDGDIVDGLPHGHGTKRTGDGPDVITYVGEWIRGVEQGYGVEVTAEHKYLGMWCSGAKNGAGCLVNIDGVYCHGTWHYNQLTENGVMIFPDGARYEGRFLSCGKFSGLGTLIEGRRKYVGKFEGNFENFKFNGEVTTINADEDFYNLPEIVPAESKWNKIFDGWNEAVGNDPSKVWTKIANQLTNSSQSSSDVPDSVSTIPDLTNTIGPDNLTTEKLTTIENYLSYSFKLKSHPLCHLFSKLIEAFTISYGEIKTVTDSKLLSGALKVIKINLTMNEMVIISLL